MLALRLTVLCLLFCGSYGYWFNLFNKCNSPQTLVGKFCAALFDNDVDEDGDVDNKDYAYDGITYNYDQIDIKRPEENLCELTRADVVTRWTCRFGMSEEYGRFMFDSFDSNNDGIVSNADFSGPVLMTHPEFLQIEYTRFKNDYCGVPANRQNKIDRVLCAEADALKLEDVKCD